MVSAVEVWLLALLGIQFVAPVTIGLLMELRPVRRTHESLTPAEFDTLTARSIAMFVSCFGPIVAASCALPVLGWWTVLTEPAPKLAPIAAVVTAIPIILAAVLFWWGRGSGLLPSRTVRARVRFLLTERAPEPIWVWTADSKRGLFSIVGVEFISGASLSVSCGERDALWIFQSLNGRGTPSCVGLKAAAQFKTLRKRERAQRRARTSGTTSDGDASSDRPQSGSARTPRERSD